MSWIIAIRGKDHCCLVSGMSAKRLYDRSGIEPKVIASQRVPPQKDDAGCPVPAY